MRLAFRVLVFLSLAAGFGFIALLTQCTNSPHRAEEVEGMTLFTSFSRPPTRLDPARSYFSHEGDVLDNIYEPPFTYHYLKRPYKLIPLTVEAMPEPAYFDKEGNRLDRDAPANQVARAEYTLKIKQGILYQDHPCFAKDAEGNFLYRNLSEEDLEGIETPNDFPVKGTRELVAEDFALEVRRVADPRLASPVLSTFERCILGLKELRDAYDGMLEAERERRRTEVGAAYNQDLDEKNAPIILDYMAAQFPGVVVVDRYTFKLVLSRKYPQILYWMAMHFFCPMPQEALDFYDQPPLVARQIVLNRWPVGTGPYYLHTFLPNQKIVLERNKNFRGETYPTEGEESDREAGFLEDAGKPVPFVDRRVSSIEKEAIPRWNKFLQGYYDEAGVLREPKAELSSDVFDQAVSVSSAGDLDLSPLMIERGIEKVIAYDTAIYNFGFNMKDKVVGGYSEEKCKLRQAISIALPYGEYIDIFLNGRGLSAQGPIPPGIFGYEKGEAGTNPVVDKWNPLLKRHDRQDVEKAKRLLAEAGYPGGRDANGKPLTLYLDHYSGDDATFPSVFAWLRGKLERIGIVLEERPTELSRFRQKVDEGNWQMMRLGWLADYPDPENFLFLLYGPNGKVESGGENNSNYASAEFDALFEEMESMENGPERKAVIDKAIAILRHDAPWIWGYNSMTFGMYHQWAFNMKPHQMSKNTLKYHRVDPQLRAERQRAWNKPLVWPLALAYAALLAVFLPGAIIVYRRREKGL